MGGEEWVSGVRRFASSLARLRRRWRRLLESEREKAGEAETHHVIQERLHQTLRGSSSPTALPLVRTDGVERVDCSRAVAVDTSDCWMRKLRVIVSEGVYGRGREGKGVARRGEKGEGQRPN